MSPKFSSYLCGFRKNHNSQNFPLKMYPSKGFDTINNSLLMVKLEVYGFSENFKLFSELLK